MTWGLPRGSPLWEKKFVLWFCCFLFNIAEADGEMSNAHATLGVSAPHLYYTCPEGATVKMLCAQRGTAKYNHDVLKRGWLFTPHSDQHCVERKGPRGLVHAHPYPPGVKMGATDMNFWVQLQNVTHADQGRYCCMVLDIHVENKHKNLVQRQHSHVLLQVTPRRNGSQECTVRDFTPPGGSVPVALAIAACILALLSLPLILVLVYKQRHNVQSSRRAQELVRMDSEALGHENPVFLGGTPPVKTRTVSQIMTRQSSETGRHLLSEPGTPFTPPIHGDVFFPIEDTILESPDFMQV